MARETEEKANARIIRYSLSDVERVLEWEELPKVAGVLLFTVLNGISAMSGRCYGFGNVKRSFMKFVVNDMGIPEIYAEVLYTSKKIAYRQASWGGVLYLVVRDKDKIILSDDRTTAGDLELNVVGLARRYLKTMFRITEETPEKLKFKPVWKTKELSGRVKAYYEEHDK